MGRNRKDNWKFDGNFIEIGSIEIEPIVAIVEGFPGKLWKEEILRSYLSEHLDAIPLLRPESTSPLWETLGFDKALAPLLQLLREHYGCGFADTISLVRLCRKTALPLHRDGPEQLPPYPTTPSHFYRRSHIPIVTNPAVHFVIDGERKHLRAGEVCEINHWREHTVRNDGETDRVHLVVDWLPRADND